MAAVTTTLVTKSAAGRLYLQFGGASGNNSADTLTTSVVPTNGIWKLLSVTAVYTSSSTYTGTALTVTIDDARGSTYDKVITNGTDNGQYFLYYPTTEIRLFPGDAIVVALPAGGSGKVASCEVTVVQE